MRCSKCGAEIKPGAKFCGKCGTKVVSTATAVYDKIICPSCGTANLTTAKFCKACGHSLASRGTTDGNTVGGILGSIINSPRKGPGGITGGITHRAVSKQAKIDRNVMSFVWPALGLDICLLIGIFAISSQDSGAPFIGIIFLGLAFLIIRHLITYMQGVVDDLNKIAGPYDGQKTLNYAPMIFLITPFTLGIGNLVWYHKISSRIHNELMRRGFIPNFGADTFWLWNVIGVAFFDLGPFIFHHKLFEAMNILGHDYNTKGY